MRHYSCSPQCKLEEAAVLACTAPKLQCSATLAAVPCSSMLACLGSWCCHLGEPSRAALLTV